MCQGFRHFFPAFLHQFVFANLATSSMRVKYDVPAAWMNPYYYRFCAAWMLLMNLAIRKRLLKADGIVYISQMHLASPVHCCEQWGLNDNYLAFTHLCAFSLLPLNLINRILPRNIPRWLFLDTAVMQPVNLRADKQPLESKTISITRTICHTKRLLRDIDFSNDSLLSHLHIKKLIFFMILHRGSFTHQKISSFSLSSIAVLNI